MRSICFYFQVHQPFRLRNYRFFEIGSSHYYCDDFANKSIVRKVANKCYLPANQILLDLIKEYGCRFKVAFSISGVALEQFEMYAPDVIDSFKRLVDTGCVEILSETYSHSLVSLKNKDDFADQVNAHRDKIKNLFGVTPTAFRNTELIYSDAIGSMVAEMGYKVMLTEGAKHILGWKSPNYMYCNAIHPKLKVLCKNFRLSDDIAFRFSNHDWPDWPVTAEKYVNWLNKIDPKEEMVNLFMDYETFGEHQWAETGIFEFMKALPAQVFAHSDFNFATPSEIAEKYQPVAPIHVPIPISWADEERDLTAWLGNELQDEAFESLYKLSDLVKHTDDPEIWRDWRYLQTSDHFYYMCTKWFSDGDVHKYFNPYSTPYDAFINYMNVLSDFTDRIKGIIAYQNMDHAHLEALETLEEIGIPQIKKLPKDKIDKLLNFYEKALAVLRPNRKSVLSSALAETKAKHAAASSKAKTAEVKVPAKTTRKKSEPTESKEVKKKSPAVETESKPARVRKTKAKTEV